MADKVRIGAVSYLNTRPLVFGMEQGLGAGRIDLSYAVPAVLARQMTAGELDIALLPIIELARIEGLELVPGLGIVTLGPSRSVLIVSRCPIEQIESLALDPESRTSNILAQLLLAEVWGRRPEVVAGRPALDDALSGADAAVRIGDKALFEPIPEGYRAYDLGTIWTEQTRLPFVFAAWIAREAILDREIYQVLHQSRRQGSTAIDLIAEDYTWQGRQHPGTARDYLTHHIRFRLGSQEIQAIELFFDRAAAHGLIDTKPRVKLALQGWSECHEAAAGRGLIGRQAG
jgi:chorismate dehydratase